MFIIPNVVTTRDNDYLQIWRVGGISFETSDDAELDIRKEQLNTIWRSLGTEHFAIWTLFCPNVPT